MTSQTPPVATNLEFTKYVEAQSGSTLMHRGFDEPKGWLKPRLAPGPFTYRADKADSLTRLHGTAKTALAWRKACMRTHGKAKIDMKMHIVCGARVAREMACSSVGSREFSQYHSGVDHNLASAATLHTHRLRGYLVGVFATM